MTRLASRRAISAKATERGHVRRSPRTVPARNKTIRTYRAALEFLNSRTDFEKMVRVGYNHTNFNLSRMLRILAGLGNPHKKLKTVHVAGTKGTGSTCHMVASMLQNS